MTNTNNSVACNHLTVCHHPLAEHNLTILRDKDTSPELFRIATRRFATILANEAFKSLPTKNIKVETPLETTNGQIIDPDYDVIIAPILRAALSLSMIMEELLPTARVHHIGLYRNEETLEPVSYYNKVPKKFDDPTKLIVYVVDPMFATGGSAVAAVNIFRKIGIPEENITFVSLIAAPEGIKNFRETHNRVNLITGAVDRQLNEKGYIMPGLGDAGDRTFNTIY